MTIQNIRGTCDILPETSYIWEWMEEKARGVFANFHFKEIRTPIFEATELFSRSIGDTSDIVSKEMYTFADKKGRSITLRPEGTASVVRACIQHKLIQPGTVNKLFYIGPMFRYERPQAGRQRQFHQIGIEIINAGGFLADVEAILLLRNLFEAFGINDLKIRINTTCSRAFKPELNALLREKIKSHVSKLCPDCQERYEKNVLRIYDCKIPSCKEIIALFPKFRELLNKEDLEYFEKVKQGLELLGINYEVDDFLVRGLDYYTRTIFEIYSEKL
ncbi:MAG: Histidyl-tRNA synthetase, partial [uncultured bacterium]